MFSTADRERGGRSQRHGPARRPLAPSAWFPTWQSGGGRGKDEVGVPVGCGVSGGGGSDGRRRQRKGGGRAPYPGAASRGVGVQTGGDGRSGAGAVFTARACAPNRREVSCMSGSVVAGVGSGWPAHLGVDPDDVYQHVTSLSGARTPSSVTRSSEAGPFLRGECDISPLRRPSPLSGSPSFRLPDGQDPDQRPDHTHRSPGRPDPPRDARPHVMEVPPRCAGRPHRFHSPCLPRSTGFGRFRQPVPGARATPTRPAPFSPHPHPGAHDRHPGPAPAVAARLNPHPVRRRGRLGRPATALALPLLPV